LNALLAFMVGGWLSKTVSAKPRSWEGR